MAIIKKKRLSVGSLEDTSHLYISEWTKPTNLNNVIEKIS